MRMRCCIDGEGDVSCTCNAAITTTIRWSHGTPSRPPLPILYDPCFIPWWFGVSAAVTIFTTVACAHK